MKRTSQGAWRPQVTALLFFFSAAVLSVPRDAASKPQIEVVPVTQHGDGVEKLWLSDDERIVVTVGQDETIKIWDYASGRLIRTLDTTALGIAHGAFALVDVVPSLHYMVAVHQDGSLKVWDLETGGLVRVLVHNLRKVESVAITEDGTGVVTAQDNEPLKLWDMQDGKLKRTFGGHATRRTEVFPNGDSIFVFSGDDPVIKQWSLSTGRQILSLSVGKETPSDLAMTPDGRRLVCRAGNTLKIWDLVSGRLVKIIEKVGYGTGGLVIDPSGKLIYSHADEIGGENDEGGIEVRDLETGTLVRKLAVGSGRGHVFAITRDGKRLIHATRAGEITVWDIVDGRAVDKLGGEVANATYAAMAPDGNSYILESNGLQLWNLKTGKLVRSLEEKEPGSGVTGAVAAVSGDGRYLITGGVSAQLGLWDLETGRFVRKIGEGSEPTEELSARSISALAATRDGAFAFSSWNPNSLDGEEYSIDQWDLSTGRMVRAFKLAGRVNALAVSGDGQHLVSGSEDKKLRIWNTTNGNLLRAFDGFDCSGGCAISIAGNTVRAFGTKRVLSVRLDTLEPVGAFAIEPEMGVSSVAITDDGKWAARAGYFERWSLELWDLEEGRLVRSFAGLPTSRRVNVGNVAISPDGRRIVVAGTPTGVGIWDARSGVELATAFTGSMGSWLTITPAGFFAGSEKGDEWLSVVRGFEVYSVDQFFDALYRPDLVEELLKGDPNGRYKNAAAELNLEKILDSGEVPEIVLVEKDTVQAEGAGKVSLAVNIKSGGGGIGEKLIWRVNGITQGNPTPPELKGLANDPLANATVTETLTVDPGPENIIEVIAYNGAGLLATLPLRITVDKFGATTAERPRMHVLAIGVNKYQMPAYQLNYAVNDADEFTKAMTKVGSNLFAGVDVTTLEDDKVTRDGIETAFNQISTETKPGDVFVLFLSGHGVSVDGHYYYYPQNLDFAAGQDYQNGIGQDLWQEWLAKIPAQKTLLILDTCESGGASGMIKGASARETAMDQLQYATGQNLIAAAGSSDVAREGYKNHGVLTYALLEALSQPPTEGSEKKIKVGMLADYVEERVPEITKSVWGIPQKPVRKLTGNDFPIGFLTAGLQPAAGEDIPMEPTHVLIRNETVREMPAPDAPGNVTLDAGTQVRVIDLVGDFDKIARAGKKLGYVPKNAIVPLH